MNKQVKDALEEINREIIKAENEIYNIEYTPPEKDYPFGMCKYWKDYLKILYAEKKYITIYGKLPDKQS